MSKANNKADNNTANKAEGAGATGAAEKRENSDNVEKAQDILNMNDETKPTDIPPPGTAGTKATEAGEKHAPQSTNESQVPTEATAAQTAAATVPSLAPVKKGKKDCKLPPKQINAYAADLTERAKAGQFPDATIPFEHAKQYYNVSTSVLNEVMLRAILEYGLTGYKFDYTPLVPPKEENECFLNDRFMIMIGKYILEGFNEKLSPENQLKKNDKFTASFTGSEIILTLKR